MTKPTITYGHGFLTDCDDDTGWGETESSLVSTLTVVSGDFFKLEGVCNDAGNEYVYYEKDITNIAQTTYQKYKLRWKTSAASNGLGAGCQLVFDDATTQELIASTPQFDTSWQVTSGSVASGKTIDKVRFIADDYPDTIAAGTFQVYFDFLLIHQGTFTFPHFHDIEPVQLSNRYADIEVPGRVGDITQFMGMESPTIKVTGDVMSGESWGTPAGEFLIKNFVKASTEPWQWFTSDMINCKVTSRDFYISQKKGSKAQRIWNLLLKMHSLSSGDDTLWADQSWLGI